MKQNRRNITEFSSPDILQMFASVGVPDIWQLWGRCGGSDPWRSFCHRISLHLEGPSCSLQAALYGGPFLRVLRSWEPASFVAEKKGLSLLGWEWFYMFGLLQCMNGSQGLCVEKCTMPHHSCSEVILEDSGTWSGLFYKR